MLSCSDCVRPKVIVLNDKSESCNFCPNYQAECFEREKLARKILNQPRPMAIQIFREYVARTGDEVRLSGIINRMKEAE